MNCELTRTGEGVRVKFGGEFTIFNAQEACDALREAFREPVPVELSLEGVDKVDVCCLQLLCSAHRTAVREGRNIAIVDALPACLSEVFETAGWSHHITCPAEGIGSCFFEGGKRG